MSISLQARFWRALLRVIIKGQRLSLAQKREQQTKNARFMNRLPAGVTVMRTHANGIPAAWVRPENALAEKVILYLHGGGYVLGGLESHQMLCSALAKQASVTLLLPEYRLAPENPFPASLEDASQTYAWLLDQNYKPENIFIAGDSAGGGLAVATALRLRESGLPLPAALICLSPWFDLTLQGQTHQTQADAEVLLRTDELQEWAGFYAAGHDRSNPLISPVYADLRGLPRLFIQVGSDEILLDDARRLAEKAKSDGVDVILNIWDGMWHVWHSLGEFMPESRQAFQEISTFIQQVSGE
jgi:epsilon-lactone hydrolase